MTPTTKSPIHHFVRVSVRQHTFPQLGFNGWRTARMTNTWPIDALLQDRRLKTRRLYTTLTSTATHSPAILTLRLANSTFRQVPLPAVPMRARHWHAVISVPVGRLRFEIRLSDAVVSSGSLIVAPVTPVPPPLSHPHQVTGRYVDALNAIATTSSTSSSQTGASQLHTADHSPLHARSVQFTFAEVGLPALRAVVVEFATKKHHPVVTPLHRFSDTTFARTLLLNVGDHSYRFRVLFVRPLRRVTDCPTTHLGWNFSASYKWGVVSQWTPLRVLNAEQMHSQRRLRRRHLETLRREHESQIYSEYSARSSAAYTPLRADNPQPVDRDAVPVTLEYDNATEDSLSYDTANGRAATTRLISSSSPDSSLRLSSSTADRNSSIDRYEKQASRHPSFPREGSTSECTRRVPASPVSMLAAARPARALAVRPCSFNASFRFDDSGGETESPNSSKQALSAHDRRRYRSDVLARRMESVAYPTRRSATGIPIRPDRVEDDEVSCTTESSGDSAYDRPRRLGTPISTTRFRGSPLAYSTGGDDSDGRIDALASRRWPSLRGCGFFVKCKRSGEGFGIAVVAPGNSAGNGERTSRRWDVRGWGRRKDVSLEQWD